MFSLCDLGLSVYCVINKDCCEKWNNYVKCNMAI